MKVMIEYIKPYYKKMSLGFLIKFLGTIMDLLLPWILAYIIDSVVPFNNISLIIKWGLLMVVCSILAVLGNVIANRMASRVARDITKKIRHDLFTKISYLSARQLDELTIPTLVSRLSTDTYNVHQMLGMMQRIGVRAPILLLGGLIVTFSLEPVLTLVLASVLPFITIVVYLVSKKGIPLYSKVQISNDKMVRVVRENISGIRVIKALSKENYEKERFNNINEEVVEKEMRAGKIMAITNPMMSLLLNIGLTLIIIVGAYRVNLGISQPGKIISFLSYFTIILTAMLAITRVFVIYSKAIASMDRIVEILNINNDLIIEQIDKVEEEYHIVFDKVDFSYNNKNNNVKQIDFKLKKGETLGIIGPTGSGKTTIIQLLLRLYDVSSGSIRINGENIKSIPFEKLHSLFGVVMQKDVLLADTISENITFGRIKDLNNIEKAIEFAQAKEFIMNLDEKIDYKLTSKATNLSGGQKQRVLLSRALYNNPEILILDDSSSALDYKTDANLRKALSENFSETTKIIIAQRISSIMYANEILVLEDGVVIASGTHQELLETCSLYKKISDNQIGG